MMLIHCIAKSFLDRAVSRGWKLDATAASTSPFSISGLPISMLKRAASYLFLVPNGRRKVGAGRKLATVFSEVEEEGGQDGCERGCQPSYPSKAKGPTYTTLYVSTRIGIPYTSVR